MGIDICFVVGGNGGNAGAAAIQAELQRNNVICSVIGVPKSIDNDILLIDKCFGFDTAVEEAQRALISAKVEASSAYHGVGVVKVMGRSSGFIALNASMASGVVDIVSVHRARGAASRPLGSAPHPPRLTRRAAPPFPPRRRAVPDPGGALHPVRRLGPVCLPGEGAQREGARGAVRGRGRGAGPAGHGREQGGRLGQPGAQGRGRVAQGRDEGGAQGRGRQVHRP
jgi:hypothetical protein